MSENVSDSFRQFVERSADPLLVHANMHPLYANPAFLRLVGLGSFEALVENGIEAVIAPHDRARVRANHAARMSGQRAPRTLDVDLLHRDGRCIAVESHVAICEFEGQRCVSISISDTARRLRDAIKEIEAKDRLMADIVNAIPAIVHLKDRQGRYTFVNARFCEELGVSEDDALGRSPHDLIDLGLSDATHEGVAQFDAVDEEAWASPTPLPFRRFPYQDTAGRQLYWVTAKRRLEVGARKEPLLLTMSMNIVEQVRAEQALSEREEQLRGILDNLPGAAFRARVGPDGTRTFLFVSDGVRELFGFPPEAFQHSASDPLMETIAPEQRTRLRSEAAACYAAGQPYSTVLPIVTRDGTDKWLLHRSHVVANDSDGWVVDSLLLDVSDQVRAENALRDREAQLQALLDNLPGAAFRTEIEFGHGRRLLLVSEGFRELYGWDASDHGNDSGRLLELVLEPDESERLRLGINSAFETGQPYSGIYSVRTKSGMRKWVAVRARASSIDADRAIVDSLAIDVTDQIVAEQALREREAQFKGLLDNLPGAAFQVRLTPEGERLLLFVSDGFREIYGWELDEHGDDAGSLTERMMSPEDLESFRKGLYDALAAEEAYTGVHRVRTKDGEQKWVLFRAKTNRLDDDGRVVDSLAIDITDQILAEQALRDREAQLAAMMANLPGAATRSRFLPDGSRELIYMSDGVLAMTGFTAEEIRSNQSGVLEAIVERSELNRVYAESEKAFAAGQIYDATIPIRHRDGRRRWLLQRGHVVTDASGDRMIDSLFIDVTDQIVAEQALQEREVQLSALLANLPGVAARVRVGHDHVRETLFVSDGIFELSGWRADELVGERWTTHTQIHDREAIEPLVQESYDAYADGRPFTATYPIVCKNGERRWVMERSHVVMEVEDAWIVDSILIDVTEQRQMQQQLEERDRRLRELQAELLQASRASAMGTLSSAIAHEISQPLAAVGNYLAATEQLLSTSDVRLPDKVSDYLGKTRQQAERAGTVISSLRRFFERGELNIQSEDINAVIDEAAALALLDREATDTVAAFDYASGLRPVSIDRVQIQQVIVNLIRNAVQAMSGTGQKELTVRTRADEDGVVVEVEDHGPGLPPDIADRIFDRFTTTRPSGMGMGLAICKSVLQAHDSELQFRTAEPAGTVFHFKLYFEAIREAAE